MSDDKTAQYAWTALPSRTHEADQTVQWSQAGDPAAWGLRPPAEHAGKSLHWLEYGRRLDGDGNHIRDVVRWGGAAWYTHASADPVSPQEAAERMWRYLGPAEWRENRNDAAWYLAQRNACHAAIREQKARITELEAKVAAQSDTIARLAGVQQVGRAHDFSVPQRSECDIFGYGAPDAEAATHAIPLPKGAFLPQTSIEQPIGERQAEGLGALPSHPTPLPRKAMR